MGASSCAAEGWECGPSWGAHGMQPMSLSFSVPLSLKKYQQTYPRVRIKYIKRDCMLCRPCCYLPTPRLPPIPWSRDPPLWTGPVPGVGGRHQVRNCAATCVCVLSFGCTGPCAGSGARPSECPVGILTYVRGGRTQRLCGDSRVGVQCGSSSVWDFGLFWVRPLVTERPGAKPGFRGPRHRFPNFSDVSSCLVSR